MEEKKVVLTDSLVKAASWTHNNNVNKLGYTLVIGKTCNLPGLIIGNVASESVSDTEAMQKDMEMILETATEFRDRDMCLKLKDCQKVWIREYQHQGPYIEGDKAWYQYHNSNA